MAQLTTTTTTTVGVSLACEKIWPTRGSRSELAHTMEKQKPRRGLRGYVGQKVLALPTYPIFNPISLSASWSYYYSMNSTKKPAPRSESPVRYSVARGAQEALEKLIAACGNGVPSEFTEYLTSVTFSSPSSNEQVLFPCPLKEQDAIAAIKALEACAAAAIADLRWKGRDKAKRSITVDLDRSACFLMSAYLTTINGMDKTNGGVKEKIKDTDLNKAQSKLYRRLSANLYKTKDGRYYHIHGSLDATAVLESLGLSPSNDAVREYEDCKNVIGEAVARFTVDELEAKNREAKGAGTEAISWARFQETKHGKVLCAEPPFSLHQFPPIAEAKPGKFAFSGAEFTNDGQQEQVSGHRVLSGIKVLEMCRVIAGPTIGRSLAAHGASVMKVTSPTLPDVPFFQVDVNTGKHCLDLNLKKESDREIFESLLSEADVIIDGYRHGALEGLGYGVEELNKIAGERGQGFVYVAEDCFGGIGNPDAEWAGRRGWQQIADCATGVAWAQGRFMGLEGEPVIPPFPMSDYGTGALGCIAAMAGLYRRATEGGTWVCRTSLCQYDVFLMKLGELPEEEQRCLRKEHGAGSSSSSSSSDNRSGFFGLRHNDSVDEVGKRALESMRRNSPHIFHDNKRLMQTARSESFENGVVEWPREAIAVDGVIVGHVRPARNNGFDSEREKSITWDNWEVDEEMAREIGLFKGNPEYC